MEATTEQQVVIIDRKKVNISKVFNIVKIIYPQKFVIRYIFYLS